MKLFNEQIVSSRIAALNDANHPWEEAPLRHIIGRESQQNLHEIDDQTGEEELDRLTRWSCRRSQVSVIWTFDVALYVQIEPP
jgi:hypothetical protein